MSFAEDAADSILDAFEAHAETVTVDVAGVAVEAQAVRIAPSEEQDGFTRRTTHQTVRLQMLASEVAPSGLASAIVSAGAEIVLADGERRLAQGVAQWLDAQRLVVEVDTRPATEE